MFSVRVVGVPTTQVLHKSPPVSVAATTERSLEVHDVLAGGTVCANDIEIHSKLNVKKAHSFFAIVDFDFIQLGLVK